MSRYSRSRMSRRAELARRRSRRANSSIPGYDNLGWQHFGHPASSDQADLEQYGIDSDFGEGVHSGPYRSGPAPASYGWEPEHPAVSDELAEDYALTDNLRQENLKKAMERKAAKCIRIAESRLGRNASQQEIEDLALRYMDLPNRTVNSRVARLSENHMGHGMFDEYDLDQDDMISMDEWGGSGEIFDDLDLDGDGLLSRDEVAMGLGDSFADEMEADEELASIMADLESMSDEEMSSAEMLAEEIAQLKAANARLANKVRKLAEEKEEEPKEEESSEEEEPKEEESKESSKKAKEEEAEEEESSEEEAEEKSKESSKKATRLSNIERLAQALSSYMAEHNQEGELASLLAELEASEEEASQNDPQLGYMAEDMMAEDMMAGKGTTVVDDVVQKEVMSDDMLQQEVMSDDIMGLDMDAEDMMAMDPRLASIFTAAEEEEESKEEEAEEESKEEAKEEEAKEEDSKESSKKKASYRPSTSARQSSVKTLGNISREASSSSDELSKLWATAPDVSKFFG